MTISRRCDRPSAGAGASFVHYYNIMPCPRVRACIITPVMLYCIRARCTRVRISLHVHVHVHARVFAYNIVYCDTRRFIIALSYAERGYNSSPPRRTMYAQR